MKRTEKEVSETTREELKAFEDSPPDDAIQLRFNIYHEANPNVYRLLVKYTRDAIAAARERGRDFKRYGIQAVAERVRWHVNFETVGEPEFKISNDFLSRYARLIMSQETDLRGVFELRKLRADSATDERAGSDRPDNGDSVSTDRRSQE